MFYAPHVATKLEITRRQPWLQLRNVARRRSRSHGLAHAPEERQRPLGDAGEAFAPGVVAQVPAERRIDHVIEEGLVEPARRRLLAVGVGRIEPGGDLLL